MALKMPSYLSPAGLGSAKAIGRYVLAFDENTGSLSLSGQVYTTVFEAYRKDVKPWVIMDEQVMNESLESFTKIPTEQLAVQLSRLETKISHMLVNHATGSFHRAWRQVGTLFHPNA